MTREMEVGTDSITDPIPLVSLDPSKPDADISASISSTDVSKIYYIDATNPFSPNLIISSQPSPSPVPIPLLYISFNYLCLSKPSLRLHSGPSKTVPVIGVGHLTFFSGKSVLGIGDPDNSSETEMIWEQLDRVSKWTHAVYGFSFVFGAGEEGDESTGRKRYLWKRTKMNFFDDQGDMELVEDSGGEEHGSGESDGKEEKEVLARYEGVGVWKWKKRGRLTIKEGGGWGWEIMVILSAMALVELSRRRARLRKH